MHTPTAAPATTSSTKSSTTPADHISDHRAPHRQATAQHAAPQPARHAALWAAAFTCALTAACASRVPVPTEQMATSQAAVNSAASAGAAELAPSDLRTARDKLTQAKAALALEHPEHATRLAREAQADANLAEAKTRNAKAQNTAGALGEGNRVLREELQRATQ